MRNTTVDFCVNLLDWIIVKLSRWQSKIMDYRHGEVPVYDSIEDYHAKTDTTHSLLRNPIRPSQEKNPNYNADSHSN